MDRIREVSVRVAKENLVAANVKILGAVLNNHTFSIPEPFTRRSNWSSEEDKFGPSLSKQYARAAERESERALHVSLCRSCLIWDNRRKRLQPGG